MYAWKGIKNNPTKDATRKPHLVRRGGGSNTRLENKNSVLLSLLRMLFLYIIFPYLAILYLWCLRPLLLSPLEIFSLNTPPLTTNLNLFQNLLKTRE